MAGKKSWKKPVLKVQVVEFPKDIITKESKPKRKKLPINYGTGVNPTASFQKTWSM